MLFPLQNALTATLLDPATGDGHGQLQWNFSLDNSAVQFLGGGQTLTLTYRTTVTDSSPFAGTHATAGQNVVLTIFGQNDKPVMPDRRPSTWVIAAADRADARTSSVRARRQPQLLRRGHHRRPWRRRVLNAALSDAGVQLGTLTATMLNDTTLGTGGLVHWSFTVDPALVNALPAGAVRHETFDVVINDGASALAVEHITVTINGGSSGGGGSPIRDARLCGASYTIANDINDYGEIVGQAGNSSGPYFGWDYKEGVLTPIAVAGNTSANTVNLYGIVGGYYEPLASTPRYGFTENNGAFTNPISLSPDISTTVMGSTTSALSSAVRIRAV